MHSVNYIYKNDDDLKSFIQDEKLSTSSASTLVQIFDSSLNKKNIEKLTKFIKSILPKSTILGSSNSGTMSGCDIYDDAIHISISEFESTSFESLLYLEDSSSEAGEKILKDLVKEETKCVLIFVNNLEYKSDELMQGLHKPECNDVEFIISGAGDNFSFKNSFVIYETNVYEKGIVAISLNSKELICHTYNDTIWNSVGKSMKVTKAIGNCVYELDSEPILSIYEKYLGKSVTKSTPESLMQFPLMYNLNTQNITRTILGIEDNNGLIFSGKIDEGSMVRFGIGDESLAIDNSTNIYVKASMHPVESIFTYSDISRKIFFDNKKDIEYQLLSKLGALSGCFGNGKYLNGDLSNVSSVVLTLSESKESKSNLQMNILKQHNGSQSEKALSHLLDVTSSELQEQTRHNTKLSKIYDQYKYALDTATLVSKTDTQGTITYVNDKFCELSGYSADELMGKPHSIVRHADMSGSVFKGLWETIKSKNIWSGMIQNRNKDGSSYFVHATIFPIIDENGKTIEYMSLREDLTSMIMHERSLHSEQRRLYQILDNQSSIVVLTSSEGYVEYLNKKFFDCFDFLDLEDFLSEYDCICDLYVDASGESIGCGSDCHLNILDGETAADSERVYMLDRNANVLSFNISTKKIEVEGKKPMYLSTLSDITEVENSRIHAEEAMRAKSDFLANMSHEVRTPLNGIIGFTELLEESSLDEKQVGYVDIVKNSANMLLGIVNGILDFSKLENGKQELELVPTNLFTEIEHIYLQHLSMTKKKNIDYRVEVDRNIYECLNIDLLHLKQVISNLINNAIKFTPEDKSITIRLTLESDTESSQSIKFSVKDTGIGIPKQRQVKIFEAFLQEDNSTTRKYGGTGLGLSISSSLINLMGSKINLNSEKDKGSEFFFTVNFDKCIEKALILEELLTESYVQVIYDSINSQKVIEYLGSHNIQTHTLDDITSYNRDSKIIILFNEEEAIALYNTLNDESYLVICIVEESELTSNCLNLKLIHSFSKCSTKLYNVLSAYSKLQIELSSEGKSFKGINVLVAEDNEINQMLISEILNKLDITSVIVNDGYEAIVSAQNNHYDVIFMDIQMPVVNGIEATKAILEDSLNKETPIVAMTSNVLEDDIVRYKEIGMYSHIGKPFHSNDIVNLLSNLFNAEIKVITKKSSLSKISEDETIKSSLEKASSQLELPEEIINKLFHKFLLTFGLIIKEMQELQNKKDYKSIALQAHKLKGASSSMCFDKITEIAQDMERKISEYSVDETELEVVSDIYELNQEFKMLESYIEAVSDDI